MATPVQPTYSEQQIESSGKTSIQSSYVEQRSVSAAIAAAAAERISVVLKDKQLEAYLHRHEHEPGAAVAGNGHEWAVVYIAPT